MEKNDYNIALLIDSDNAAPKNIDYVIEQLSLQGRILTKRIYGNFTEQQASSWKEAINKYSLSPIQQFSYTKGKNATDSKMVIDAMDILYSNQVNAFAIMSSDSDFTGLAKRLKESGIFVFGAGKQTTPESFVNSCDRFYELKDKAATRKTSTKKTKTKKEEKDVEEIMHMSENILRENNGQIALAQLVDLIYRQAPTFDVKSYGFKTTKALFESDKRFVVLKVSNTLFVSLNEGE